MSNLAKYEKWAPEQIEEEQQALELESEFVKIKVGRTVMRILPPRPGSRSPFTKVYQHYLDVPGLQSSVSFACPRLNGNARPCMVCTKADQLRATGNPKDYAMAGDIRASKRVYANVILRAFEEAGPRIYAFGKGIHEDLMSFAHDPEYGDFSDPGPEGYDIVIDRKGTGKNDTKYKLKAARNCTPLSGDPQLMENWLTMMHDLSRFKALKSDEELEELLGGWLGVSGHKKARSTGGSSRRAADDVMEAEFVDDDEE